jgi:hypothetical protein
MKHSKHAEMNNAFNHLVTTAGNWIAGMHVDLKHYPEYSCMPLGDAVTSMSKASAGRNITGKGISTAEEEKVRVSVDAVRDAGLSAVSIYPLLRYLSLLGTDKISDIVVCLTIDYFSNFTQNMCKKLGIPATVITEHGHTITVVEATGCCLIPGDVLTAKETDPEIARFSQLDQLQKQGLSGVVANDQLLLTNLRSELIPYVIEWQKTGAHWAYDYNRDPRALNSRHKATMSAWCVRSHYSHSHPEAKVGGLLRHLGKIL